MARRLQPASEIASEEIVPVYVPARVLAQVYEALAEILTVRGSVVPMYDVPDSEPDGPERETVTDRVCPFCFRPAHRVTATGLTCRVCDIPFHISEAGVLVDSDNGAWSPAMLERLKHQLHAPLALEAISLVAERSPRPVGYSELLSHTESEPNQLRAELAVLTKTARRLFGRKTWPMTARQGWGANGEMGYRMPPEIATWWQDLELAD